MGRDGTLQKTIEQLLKTLTHHERVRQIKAKAAGMLQHSVRRQHLACFLRVLAD